MSPPPEPIGDRATRLRVTHRQLTEVDDDIQNLEARLARLYDAKLALGEEARRIIEKG